MHSKESRARLGAPANVASHSDPEFYTPPARRGGPPDVAESLASRLTALAQFADLFARHLQSLDNRLVVLEGLEKAQAAFNRTCRCVPSLEAQAVLDRLAVEEAGSVANYGSPAGSEACPVALDIGQPAGDYTALAHADDGTDLLTSGFVYLNPQGADLLGKPLITRSEAFACDPAVT